MWKPLVLSAIVANIFLITPSEANKKCTKPNEIYDVCPNPCPPRECGINKALILCAPAPKPGSKDCKPGYRCADGFLKNRAGVCISEDECQYDCPKNETLDPCYSACPPRYCGVNIAAVSCLAIDENDCERKCRCSDGFLRNAEGVCIREKDCPKCTGPNEVYDVCPNPCPPQRCDVDPRVIRCAAPPAPGDDKCKPGCRCLDGYARNGAGVCIPRDQCSPCGGDPNAVSGCGKNCGRHCSDRNNTETVLCTADCDLNGCDCRQGFWYDDNTGKCVLAEDCSPKCGKDEVYSPCTNSDCGPQKCSQLGFPIACPRIDPKYCIKGCVCKEGLVRSANGTCIPKNKCPSCRGDPNAVSGCGNCIKSCSNYNNTEPMVCIQICDLNGCDCKKGYVLDDITGKCILPNKCVSCNGDFNAQPGCDKNCTKRCPGPKPANCKCYKHSCECKNGFVFDPKTVKCVRPEQCTPTCKDNEVLSNCSNGGCGPWRCTDVGLKTGCVKMDQKNCKVDCVCKEGYVRDENEVCVPVTDCPECGGDPNAIAGCGINCGRLCSNYKQAENVSCIALCEDNACDCREGFVKDENINKCVVPEDCTPVCKEHEVYSECINGGCQARNCSQLGQPVPCIKLDPKACIKGCVCADGWLRARNGTCVPEDKCDNCNKSHEHYNPCASSCPPQTCESIGRQYKCPATAAVCRGACQCDDGYLRNKNGECIRKKDCLKCKGPHEYWSCGSACDNVCSTLYKQNQTNCPIKNIKCTERCYCEEGYARNKDNICIPIDNCPKPKCGLNERLEQCPPGLCSPQKCTQLGFPIACPDLPQSGCPTTPGCVCTDNYVRNSKGKCIPVQDCPSCGGDPNAVSGCGVNCGKTCSTYNRTDIGCIEICYYNSCDCRDGYVLDENLNKCVMPKECTQTCGNNEVYSSCANGGCGKWNCSQLGQPDLCIDVIECIGGCICQKGYLRAKNGTCVPIKECPIPSCGKNERFEFCPNSVCQPKTCSELGFELTCPEITDDTSCPSQPACICDYGFVRNKNGVCVPKDHCSSCGGDRNAKSGCGINCGRLCSNYNKGPVPCPRICKFNACDCKKDYVFDLNTNKCVRPNQCTPICGDNEVFSECINGGCQPQNCTQLGKSVPCFKINPKKCLKGCLCKEGYLRDANGVCVPKEDCEQNCKQRNEVYDACPPSCPPQTCEAIDKTYHCPLMKTDKKNCKPACRCQEGYWRNKIGQCISKKNCLKCTGPNEYWSCGVPCDNVCENLHEQNQTNCPVNNIKCTEKCYCEKGYARDNNNICVPIEKCPLPKCGENERFEDCPDWSCSPQICDQVGYPISCPALLGDINSNATCPGKPGCVCVDNYVRNDCGECIPVDECPSCGGDPNAVSGCGVNCGRLCSNYKKKNVACVLICRINGCDCKKGFVFDSNIGKCVLPEACTQVCGLNEVYDTCANGGCQKRNCSQVGKPTLCIDPIKCNGGCVCLKGFLRHKNGTCVPENQCPESQSKCSGPNEHFSCGPACDNVCATLSEQNQTNCPIVNIQCNSQCYCDEGYARDNNGICIPIDQCGVSCHGDSNAVSGCGGHCNDRCSNYKENVLVCPLICFLDACDCKQGYVFDDNLGKCVLPKDCTPVCGVNEVYNTCINGGCQKKNCSDLARPIICIHPKKCIDGCLCKEGFLRADNGTCVPTDNCPTPTCPKNEVFDRCANGGCRRRKCSELTSPKICQDPDECIGDCVCAKGYLRNEDGVCVPERNCDPQCNQPHQVFNFCPSTCPPQTCESLDRAYACPIVSGQEPPCQPGCVCEEGYFFNLIGECVSEQDCLKCTGPHEYYSCDGACDNVCLTLNEQSQTNCPIINIKCNEMCYCENGYARNASGICIPIKECPPSRCGPNERYEESPCRVCEPLTCREVGMELECPPVEDDNCDDTAGCICQYGLVRNDDDVCIPISECPSETAVNVTEARARLDQGSIALAGKFLRYLVSNNPDANCVASPTSLQIPMAQLAMYAKDSVLQQILKLLNLKSISEVKACFPGLIDEFSNQTNVDFKEATKVYANLNNPLSESFKRDSEKYVGAQAESVDFSRSKEVADIINKWVDEQTRGKIPTLVSPEMFNADTRLCLVNAIYFLGNWVKQFNPNNTQVKDFYKSNGDTVPMKIMYQENTFNYYETDLYQVLEMFYKGNNFSFVVVLPRNKEDLLPTLKAIEEPGVWDNIMESLSPHKCKVSLPKYTIDTTIDLKTMLQQIGVEKMFDSRYDGFEGMLEKPEPVYVSDAIQKAFISVDETGTEAAAATAIIFGLTSVREPPKSYVFLATRPYAFYLLYRSAKSPQKTPVFCGTFVGNK